MTVLYRFIVVVGIIVLVIKFRQNNDSDDTIEIIEEPTKQVSTSNSADPTNINTYVYIQEEEKPTFKRSRKGIWCPKCKSLNCKYLYTKRKSFSLIKAIIGVATWFPFGLIAGFIGSQGKKGTWRCNDCGAVFRKKAK